MDMPITEIKNRILQRCIPSKSGCLEWQGAVDGCGYGLIRFNGKVTKTHRLIAEATPGQHVLHSCDNPKCCNPEHLSIGNHTSNMIDRSRKFRTNGQKLTADDVRAIRSSNKRVCELAREYGVVHSAISNIRSRRRFAWLED
ncbi:hypothetical protein ACUNI2_26640 [Serratia sp. IR-2025]